jgi:hypothetical protein
MNGQGRKTIGTSSPKDRLDGQVLCPSRNSWEREHRKGKRLPEESSFSLSHFLHLQKIKILKAFGTQKFEPLPEARKGKPDVVNKIKPQRKASLSRKKRKGEDAKKFQSVTCSDKQFLQPDQAGD